MIGLVLAADSGRRPQPQVDATPTTLLCVDGETSILDIVLRNLAAVGLERAVIVVGFAAEAVEQRAPALMHRHGIALRLVHNDLPELWNDAYSLWCGLQAVDETVLLVNGDTIHAPLVEESLLDDHRARIILGVDCTTRPTDEMTKVQLDDTGVLRRIGKTLDPLTASGEYVGVSLLESAALPALRDALQTTFRRDPRATYEEAFQWLVDHGGVIGSCTLPAGTPWLEVHSALDLPRAHQQDCLDEKALP